MAARTQVMLLLFIWMITGLNASIKSGDLTSTNVNYFSSSSNTSHEDCSLSFDLYIDNITTSTLHHILTTDINITQSILHWFHLRVFQLIDSSFLHNINQFTSDLWNEYFLRLSSISNYSNNNPLVLTLSICVSSLQIQQIIQTELQTDGDEIAAFIHYKLSQFLHIKYPTYTLHNMNIDLVLISTTTTTITYMDTNTSSSSPIYVIIIGICMIISGFVVVALCIDNKLQNAIKDIRSLVRHKPHNSANTATVTTDPVVENEVNHDKSPSLPPEVYSPEIPTTPDILKEALPAGMHDAPPSSTITDMRIISIELPPKDKFRLNPNAANKISVASCSDVSVRYDYNGNIKQKYSMDLEDKAVEIQQKNVHLDKADDDNKPPQNAVCYEDGDVLGTFQLVREDALGDNLFSDVVID